MQTDNILRLFEIWYARYPSGNDPVWNIEKYGKHLGLWQYSDKGTIDGIKDIPFDLNYAYKNYPDLIKQYGFNGFTAYQAEET